MRAKFKVPTENGKAAPHCFHTPDYCTSYGLEIIGEALVRSKPNTKMCKHGSLTSRNQMLTPKSNPGCLGNNFLQCKKRGNNMDANLPQACPYTYIPKARLGFTRSGTNLSEAAGARHLFAARARSHSGSSRNSQTFLGSSPAGQPSILLGTKR